MCVFRSCVAVIRLDFCAGDRPDVLGLGLEVGLLQTLDRSWWVGGQRKAPFICWQGKTTPGRLTKKFQK